MKEQLKKLMKRYGITRSHAHVLQYWLPYNFERSGRALTPQSVTLEMTFRCNLSCQMCPLDLPRMMYEGDHKKFIQERKQVELSTGEIKDVVDDISAMGVRELTLTGGEVFLRRDLLDLLRHVSRTPLRCCVNTNGWFLGGRQVRELVEIGPESLSVSVDGPGEVHDAIRRGPGSFQRILEGLRCLKAEKRRLGRGRPKVGITCTLSSLNQHCFSELVDVFKGYQVSSVDFEFMFFTEPELAERTREMIPLAVAPKEENQDLPMQLREVDVEVMYAEMQRARAKAAEAGVTISFGPPLRTKEEIRKRFYDPSWSFVGKCFYPWKSARINPYGDVYSCSIDVAFGNVREAPFSVLWNSEAYKVFRRTLREQGLFPKCAKCCALNNALWDRLPDLGWATRPRGDASGLARTGS